MMLLKEKDKVQVRNYIWELVQAVLHSIQLLIENQTKSIQSHKLKKPIQPQKITRLI